MLSSLSGLLLSYHYSLPSGPAIILVAGIAYVVSLVLGPAGGLVARFAASSYRSLKKPMRPKMTTRRTLLNPASALVVLSLALPTAAAADEPIPVVATFSILGDMVARIGGEHVTVTTLVGPDGDTHVYQPTPAAARTVSAADLLFVNGLDFEGWIDRLVDASGFDGTRVVTTDGIEPIPFEDEDEHHDEHDEHAHDDHEGEEHAEHEHHEEDKHEEHAEAEGHDHHHHGAFDPHAWQSLASGEIYANNIADALAAADPDNAESY